METVEIIGYLSSILIGVSLGLIGGGGSILTVPVLVYLLHVEPVLATTYSLFVVGLTALFGAFSKVKNGLVSYKTAIIFAIPSFISVFLTRLYLVPAIPESIASLGGIAITKDIAIMVFFALIMLFASVSMIKGRKEVANEDAIQSFNYPMIILEGAIVGVLTGIVGAGGGFLIIPALVLLSKLPMKMAVGTSLLIIAAKSLIGFGGDLVADQNIDWTVLTSVSALAILGIFIGSYLNKYISGNSLKKGFGYFVLVMAVYIILKELFIN